MALRAPLTRRRAPQQRAEQTKTRLLEAAVDAFTTSGFDATTVADLEGNAGVQRGSVVYHFGSKDTLWRAAVDKTFNEVETTTRELFAAELANYGDDSLRALIAAFIRSNARRPELLNFIMREAKVASDRRDYIAEKHVSRFADIIVGVTGRPKSVYDFYALTGAMTFVFASPAGARRIWEIEPFSDEFIEEHIRSIQEIFSHAWKKP